MDTLSIRDREPGERPYERCVQRGPSSLTDAELLAVLLRTGTREKDVMGLASQLLSGQNRGDGLAFVLHMSYEELTAIRGIGKVKAVQLLCLGELCRRLWRQEVCTTQRRFADPAACAAYYLQEMKFLEREELRAAFLDLRFRLLGDCVLSRGTVDASLVSVREILIEALRHRAVGLLLVHNHPSGCTDPSEDDVRVTESVRLGCAAAGLRLQDHIIIGENSYYSFREHGFLPENE